ncbi:MAG: L-lysine 6-transaminase [Planctomycetota bacterium]|jgi:L-lysine 6-transaminase|nr:L-lysine 6-transaminase [Planctomycetota bacterium]
MTTTTSQHTDPQNVHANLGNWILADGYSLVLDLERSKGADLYDSRSGRHYLDFFGCFGSTPLGWNHPALTDPAWLQSVGHVVANRPANSDLYTIEMADYVARMAEVATPEGYKHMFFVEGGALAVENALKVAFDWKVRRNRAKGVDADVGTKILHFEKAFHGRSGYTLSLTNTLPDKVDYFPKFEDWPRVFAPQVKFPCEGEDLVQHIAAEQLCFDAIDAAFAKHGDDIAAILIETMQCEGGDRYFRAEFLQGLQARCEKYDCLFICDEVQTGYFGSGKPWMFQQYGITPDVFSFGKKSQQCGIMASPRIDQVPDNVFEKSSRINSTWGGNLVDMVRATRVLEVVRDDNLCDNAAARGTEWLEAMQAMASQFDQIGNPRGMGLLMAFDMPNGNQRDALLGAMMDNGMIGLGSGERTVRFRPHLAITSDDVSRALELTEKSLKSL